MAFLPPQPWSLSQSTRWLRYALSLLAVASTSLFSFAVGDRLSEDNDMLFYLSSTLFVALYLGRGPARLGACGSLAVLSVARVHPGFRVGFQGSQYLFSFGFFLILADQIGRLADQVRREAWLAHRQERGAELLARFASDVSDCESAPDVLALLQSFAIQQLRVHLTVHSEHGQRPLRTLSGAQAWVNYPALEAGEEQVIVSLCEQTAHALERLESLNRMQRAQILEATQKLQSTLLHSISHDLQTPLSSISGSLELLRHSEAPITQESQGDLLELASEQTQGLQRLVKNILNLCKLEGGALQLQVGWVSLEEVVKRALIGLPRESQARVQLHFEEDLQEVRGDFTLLVQVFSNLLDNALKFSPASAAVQVHGSNHSDRVEVRVTDQGCGVVESERKLIFGRFYRGQTPGKMPGSGLGLSICQSILELHHGQIGVEPHPAGGCSFSVNLPMPRKEPQPQEARLHVAHS